LIRNREKAGGSSSKPYTTNNIYDNFPLFSLKMFPSAIAIFTLFGPM
jgi:hypothetical protein